MDPPMDNQPSENPPSDNKPSRIKWDNTAERSIIAAMIAASDFKLNYNAIAYYFGRDASYDVIEGHLRPLKQQARQMKADAEAAGSFEDWQRRAGATPRKRATTSKKDTSNTVRSGRIEKDTNVTPTRTRASHQAMTPTPSQSARGRTARGRRQTTAVESALPPAAPSFIEDAVTAPQQQSHDLALTNQELLAGFTHSTPQHLEPLQNSGMYGSSLLSFSDYNNLQSPANHHSFDQSALQASNTYFNNQGINPSSVGSRSFDNHQSNAPLDFNFEGYGFVDPSNQPAPQGDFSLEDALRGSTPLQSEIGTTGESSASNLGEHTSPSSFSGLESPEDQWNGWPQLDGANDAPRKSSSGIIGGVKPTKAAGSIAKQSTEDNAEVDDADFDV